MIKRVSPYTFCNRLLCGIYFHGKIEEFCGGDLVSATRNLKCGIHPVKVKNLNCVAYIWQNHRGLIVLKEDKEANEYARECFRLKSEII